MSVEQRINALEEVLRGKLGPFNVFVDKDVLFGEEYDHTLGRTDHRVKTCTFKFSMMFEDGTMAHWNHALSGTHMFVAVRDDRYWGYLANWLPTEAVRQLMKGVP